MKRPTDMTGRFTKGDEVPKPRIELGTRGFLVHQQRLCIETSAYLVEVGQVAEQLLLSMFYRLVASNRKREVTEGGKE